MNIKETIEKGTNLTRVCLSLGLALVSAICEKMSIWNYVVTAHKPTNVTHSQDLNLIIVKCTRIEIHLLTPQGLQPMLDVPIYGRIATLELFRSHGEAQDFLFIATERYKFCVLQWDSETSELVTRLVLLILIADSLDSTYMMDCLKLFLLTIEDNSKKHSILGLRNSKFWISNSFMVVRSQQLWFFTKFQF
ncbi:DNA damage-binding protein 1a [Stylosanthes scabra]|uniref:DNA damage-binding protein 1a n=1 Tax=Stylosanthes scabra TaxID=79078 RepID=A0ABU6ZCF7_9FABA|nr:DNA damage-binding protein 1a [Stylosanthes scabra]